MGDLRDIRFVPDGIFDHTYIVRLHLLQVAERRNIFAAAVGVGLPRSLPGLLHTVRRDMRPYDDIEHHRHHPTDERGHLVHRLGTESVSV